MHRVLFCIGINQNFMNAPVEEGKQVWQAFSQMMQGIDQLPGVTILGIMDDDRIMVGPSATAPWTAYIMADVPDYESVVAACNFFRTTPVGDGTYKLWKYARVEARIGRELVVPE
ncbi:IacB protein [Halomonas pacifica]|uniref:IacB protein n=1 Tax=Bisbaumannia pacifica TaxID=77098 RepID=A0ABD4L5H5_9GAMM|nr:IacB protein [Halomonas pacifica]MBH8581955.1 IacB protein [Halomonas pacifica]MDC8801957.1 IacB protein [Halomonas pacifica]